MTTNHHPITPPPEMVQQWLTEGHHQDYCSATEHAIAQAARWGADQELKACCEWVEHEIGHGRASWGDELHAIRRPKPPSLAEQALEVVTSLRLGECVHRNGAEMDVLTAALERLKELEKGNE